MISYLILSSMASSKSVDKSSHLAFLRLKRLLNGVGYGTITGWTVTQIGRFCVRGIGSRTYFSHISEKFEDTKMRSGLYPFFHIALLNDFGSFAVWMTDNLFESANCSTAFRRYPLWCIPRCYHQTISNKTELPCLLCGRSATSVIPGAWFFGSVCFLET